ncbi:unnamed protein product [Polarella glacialis]|uniref:Uncharacterized protein n=1 Tax=Polarella glacialis TaxID=89957 RepID=A0A813LB90_POLGL|nr:unnamed protein product [Polarella glacialis]
MPRSASQSTSNDNNNNDNNNNSNNNSNNNNNSGDSKLSNRSQQVLSPLSPTNNGNNNSDTNNNSPLSPAPEGAATKEESAQVGQQQQEQQQQQQGQVDANPIVSETPSATPLRPATGEAEQRTEGKPRAKEPRSRPGKPGTQRLKVDEVHDTARRLLLGARAAATFAAVKMPDSGPPAGLSQRRIWALTGHLPSASSSGGGHRGGTSGEYDGADRFHGLLQAEAGAATGAEMGSGELGDEERIETRKANPRIRWRPLLHDLEVKRQSDWRLNPCVLDPVSLCFDPQALADPFRCFSWLLRRESAIGQGKEANWLASESSALLEEHCDLPVPDINDPTPPVVEILWEHFLTQIKLISSVFNSLEAADSAWARDMLPTVAPDAARPQQSRHLLSRSLHGDPIVPPPSSRKGRSGRGFKKPPRAQQFLGGNAHVHVTEELRRRVAEEDEEENKNHDQRADIDRELGDLKKRRHNLSLDLELRDYVTLASVKKKMDADWWGQGGRSAAAYRQLINTSAAATWNSCLQLVLVVIFLLPVERGHKALQQQTVGSQLEGEVFTDSPPRVYVSFLGLVAAMADGASPPSPDADAQQPLPGRAGAAHELPQQADTAAPAPTAAQKADIMQKMHKMDATLNHSTIAALHVQTNSTSDPASAASTSAAARPPQPSAAPTQPDHGWKEVFKGISSNLMDHQSPSLSEELLNQGIINEELLNQRLFDEELLNQRLIINQRIINEEPLNQRFCDEELFNQRLFNEDLLNQRLSDEEPLNPRLINEELLSQRLFEELLNQRLINNQRIINEELLNQRLCDEELLAQRLINEELPNQRLCDEELLIQRFFNENLLNPRLCDEELLNQRLCNEELFNQRLINERFINVQLINNQRITNEDLLNQRLTNEELLNQRLFDEELINQRLINEEPLNQRLIKDKAEHLLLFTMILLAFSLGVSPAFSFYHKMLMICYYCSPIFLAAFLSLRISRLKCSKKHFGFLGISLAITVKQKCSKKHFGFFRISLAIRVKHKFNRTSKAQKACQKPVQNLPTWLFQLYKQVSRIKFNRTSKAHKACLKPIQNISPCLFHPYKQVTRIKFNRTSCAFRTKPCTPRTETGLKKNGLITQPPIASNAASGLLCTEKFKSNTQTRNLKGLPVTPMRVPTTKVPPMRVINPSSHYSWHHCFLSQRTKRSNSHDRSCLNVSLWLMKIVPGCIYMWLAPCNFHVKQAAHLHGNTAAHPACHAHHCNYQAHFGHAQYMKAHSNMPNHDTWKNYEHNQQFTVHSQYSDAISRSSNCLEQQKTINSRCINSLIEQCLIEEQELISQLAPPLIHSTQYQTNGHSVAPPAKTTPETNSLFEQWLYEDQFHDSDFEPTHLWDEDIHYVDRITKVKWPNGSPPTHPPNYQDHDSSQFPEESHEPTHFWDEDIQYVDTYYKVTWPNGSPSHQHNGSSQTANESDESTQYWDEDINYVDRNTKVTWSNGSPSPTNLIINRTRAVITRTAPAVHTSTLT